jgi:hypothetical protein
MSFADDVRRFSAKTGTRAKALHDGVSDLAFSSIVEGSPVTGAPGQPVDIGYLKGSWQNIVEGPLTRQIVTNVAYAPAIEDDARTAFNPAGAVPDPEWRKAHQRGGTNRKGPSQVGGHHSVKLTRAAWQRIVDFVTAKVVTHA